MKRKIIRKEPNKKINDPYLLPKSLPDPTICPSCNLLYHDKRWIKNDELANMVSMIAYQYKCPACRKIEDRYVMGVVNISGNFYNTHKEDIINLIKNTEKKEILRNPLDRIMSLKNVKGMMVVETTSENLAIAIGKALKRAYKGNLEIKFSSDNKFVRVNWQRD